VGNLRILLRGKNYSSGNTWNDESGNGRHATLAGGIAAKFYNNGIVLNGSTFWTFPNVAVGNSWSLGVWYMRTAANPANTWPAIVTQQIGHGSNSANMMFGYYLGYYGISQRLCMSYWGPGNWWWSPTDITPLFADNQWVNIQVTWDGTNLATYVNGNLLESVKTNVNRGDGAGPFTQMLDNGLPYNIGRAHAGDFVRGVIGEVRIYNTPLTSSQVKSVYNESAADFSRSALPPEVSHTLSTELSFVVNHNDTFGIQMWGPTTTASSWGGSMLLEKAPMVQGGGYIISDPAIGTTKALPVLLGGNQNIQLKSMKTKPASFKITKSTNPTNISLKHAPGKKISFRVKKQQRKSTMKRR
jgi:hypothetical protein